MQKQAEKNILLTGATGFLGSHLLRAFLEMGWAVSIIKRSFSRTHRIQYLLPKVAILDVDNDPLASIFEQQGPFDAVVHTAACYGRHNETVGQVMMANLVFAFELLEAATFFNTTTFFNAATILNTYQNSYALSKRQFEDWGKMIADQGKIGFVNLKLEHMYGPDDDPTKFTTFIFNSLKSNVPQIELTPGEQKRDFIYIDDVVLAYVVLLENQGKIAGFSEYEIGSGNAVSIRAFVERSKELAGSKTKLLFGARDYREHEIMFSQADIKKLRKIGWEPKVSLDHGILNSL